MASNPDLLDSLRSARDHLVTVMADYDKAVETFEWPRITGPFNWATDWFDAIARGNDRVALWIVEEDGRERKVTFDEMARRSDQVATWLGGLGVGKGDRVILMLGNQVELWESMLAVAKLGAVIMPTTGALGPADLADRIRRGGAGFVIANATDASKFAEVDGDYVRIAVGAPVDGWRSYSDADAAEAHPHDPQTTTDDPLLVYFTSGTTSKPKLVEHSQISYPVGHLTTMAWLGVRPGDVHLAISAPGWAKHAWSCFFTPWIAEATIFVYNYARFDAAALLGQLRRAGVNTFCAPPTVWRMLIQADLGERPAGLREVLGAGEPLNPEVISAVERAWGLTIRDGFGQTETTLQIGNTPGQPVKAGSMGRPMPGVPVVLVDRHVDDATFDIVKVDNVRGSYIAVRHLIDLGYQRIAMITGLPDVTPGFERPQGYYEAMRNAGRAVHNELIRPGDFKDTSGYLQTLALMALPEPPDAIFAVNALTTIGVLRALRELGLRVPYDVALVGFDEMPYPEIVHPGLTVVAQPSYEIGQQAVQFLMRRRREPKAAYMTVTLQPRLIIRESCGAHLRTKV